MIGESYQGNKKYRTLVFVLFVPFDAVAGDDFNCLAALMLGYDEGYLSDDKVLAGAVWRNLLNKDPNVEPETLYKLVHFIHKNLQHLQTIEDKQLLEGYVTFIDLDSDKANKRKAQEILETITGILS